MKRPAFRIAKKGRNVFSEKPEDFILNSDFNTLKIIKQGNGHDTFYYNSSSDYHCSQKFTVKHGLGYQPFVLGYYTSSFDPDSLGGRLDEPRWYLMNSRSHYISFDENIAGAWEFCSYADAGSPSGTPSDNDSLEEITFQIYTYNPAMASWGGASGTLNPMNIFWKYFIFADPQDWAWFK